MNTTVKNVLLFVGGAVTGVLVSKKYFQNKYEQFAQDEINNAMEYDRRRREIKPVKLTVEDYKEALTENGYITESSDEDDEEGDCCESMEELCREGYEQEAFFEQQTMAINNQKIKEKHKGQPYVIYLEAFDDEEPAYEKVTLNFYALDHTLADESEEIIPDIVDVIGEHALSAFGYGSGDQDIVFVRNDQLGVDYEVIRQHKSYKESVLGE